MLASLRQNSTHIPLRSIRALGGIRGLLSRQLMYSEFGDPMRVIGSKQLEIPKLEESDVLVRMMGAPVNPSDISTIRGLKGKTGFLPKLPAVPGLEGVAEVLELGSDVRGMQVGQRVIFKKKNLGTWRDYGVFKKKDLRTISKNIPIEYAATLSIAPCIAYRLLTGFLKNPLGATVIQNAPTSPVGQCVIQLCAMWGITTINIVPNKEKYDLMEKYLYRIGATYVYTSDQVESLLHAGAYLGKAQLVLNCRRGTQDHLLTNFLVQNGVIVHYGDAYSNSVQTTFPGRPDIQVRKFLLRSWEQTSSDVEKDIMMRHLSEAILLGKLVPPYFEVVDLDGYKQALRNTTDAETLCSKVYIIDFTTTS